MDLYLLAELKTVALKITTVDMLKPPPDFRYHPPSRSVHHPPLQVELRLDPSPYPDRCRGGRPRKREDRETHHEGCARGAQPLCPGTCKYLELNLQVYLELDLQLYLENLEL